MEKNNKLIKKIKLKLKLKLKLKGIQKINEKTTAKKKKKKIKRMSAKQTYMFQINIRLFFSLMSVYIKKIAKLEANRFGRHCKLQNIRSE